MEQYDSATNELLGIKGFREVPTSGRTVRIPNLSISDLEINEKLLIWRRREGYTQRQAAPILGMSFTAYKAIERQKMKCNVTDMPFIGDLYSYEICFILRKRLGWTIPECAKQAGVSRYWYNLMEQGKVCHNKLVEYWGENER